MTDLIGRLRDDSHDASVPQVGPDRLGRVSFVTAHTVRAGSLPARTGSVDSQMIHEVGEHWRVSGPARGTISTNGWPVPSTRAWILVLSRPRERPNGMAAQTDSCDSTVSPVVQGRLVRCWWARVNRDGPIHVTAADNSSPARIYRLYRWGGIHASELILLTHYPPGTDHLPAGRASSPRRETIPARYRRAPHHRVPDQRTALALPISGCPAPGLYSAVAVVLCR